MGYKIGILTQPLQNNYGGLLQNYALQQILIQNGYEVETIDHGSRAWYWVVLDQFRVWNRYFLSGLKKEKKPKYRPSDAENKVLSQNTNAFINRYISHTEKMHSYGDFRRCAKEKRYDAYIVGSDQCWRPSYNNFILAMFLNFVENDNNIKRVAYAASFGTDRWEIRERLTPICARLSKLFNIITVREKSGIDLCSKYLGVKAEHVLDPTMLLNRVDYEKIVLEEKAPPSLGNLFHYILDPTEEKKNLIGKIAKENGLTPFTIMPKCQAENRTKYDIKNRIDDCVFPSVTKWLRGFMDAKMVLVDSFHGAVFSIIFNKPFWVIGNKKRGNTRFDSLLNLFDLNDRLIKDLNTSDIDWNKPINWEYVNNIGNKTKERSIKLLLDSLK